MRWVRVRGPGGPSGLPQPDARRAFLSGGPASPLGRREAEFGKKPEEAPGQPDFTLNQYSCHHFSVPKPARDFRLLHRSRPTPSFGPARQAQALGRRCDGFEAGAVSSEDPPQQAASVRGSPGRMAGSSCPVLQLRVQAPEYSLWAAGL